MNAKEFKTTFQLAKGIYLECVTVVNEHVIPGGEVVYQEVLSRHCRGEGVPEEIIKEYTIWWEAGFIGPQPEKIEKYLLSLSAGGMYD